MAKKRDIQVIGDMLESYQTLNIDRRLVIPQRLDPVVKVDEQFPSNLRGEEGSLCRGSSVKLGRMGRC